MCWRATSSYCPQGSLVIFFRRRQPNRTRGWVCLWKFAAVTVPAAQLRGVPRLGGSIERTVPGLCIPDSTRDVNNFSSY